MANQIEVSLDQEVYDRLIELQVPPYNRVSDVIERLLYHGGRKSKEAIALESEEHHFSYEEELERANEGIYDSSGISS